MDRPHHVDSPAEFAAGSGATRTRFVQKAGYYAVLDWDEDADGGAPVLVLDEAAIFEGDASRHADRKEGPVYEVQPSGAPAVPTGRIFVRFADNVVARERGDALRKAGYVIVDSPPWAPQSVWVEARSGDVADALSNMEKLRRLADVENVEPQILMPAAARV